MGIEDYFPFFRKLRESARRPSIECERSCPKPASRGRQVPHHDHSDRHGYPTPVQGNRTASSLIQTLPNSVLTEEASYRILQTCMITASFTS